MEIPVPTSSYDDRRKAWPFHYIPSTLSLFISYWDCNTHKIILLFNSDWTMHPSFLLLVLMPRSFTIFQSLSPLPLPRLPTFIQKVSPSAEGRKLGEVSGPIPSNGPRNGFARIKIITDRTIKTNRNINSWYSPYNMKYTDGYLSCYPVSMIFHHQ